MFRPLKSNVNSPGPRPLDRLLRLVSGRADQMQSFVFKGRVAQINLSEERALPKTDFMRCVRNWGGQVRSSD